MLVLSRRETESIVIGNVEVTVMRIKGGKVRVGIDAPKEIKILRKELEDVPRNGTTSEESVC